MPAKATSTRRKRDDHAERFKIAAERRGSTHRITAEGELGPRASFKLHDEFYRALPSDATTIVVDLSRVTAVNRSAINTLAFMRRRSAGRLRIIPSSAVVSAVHGLAAAARSGEVPPQS